MEANRRCYSNGVKEITTMVDGGSLIVLTKTDGTTTCYQVFAEGTGAGPQHYQNAAGQDVGLGRSTPDGGYQFTCDGTTVEVNFADPACATQNGARCIGGSCP